jgi:hypothetical protein
MTTMHQATREYAIEQIMALYGRYQPNPKSYREHLNALDVKELAELYEDVMRNAGE